MRTVRPLLLLPLVLAVATGLSSCGSLGGGLAGGQGDPNLFDVVPAVPSVPVQLGEYLVKLGTVKTNPSGLIDQFASLGDTHTIKIAAGPASNVIAVSGEYLDPRINDLMYLRDRGGNTWLGESTGATYSLTITTDATGAPQIYLLATDSNSTTNFPILSQRYFDFGFPIGAPPGLWAGLVETNTNPQMPLHVGDWQYFVIRSDGVGQWERDVGTSLMWYWLDPGGNEEGQFTQFNTGNQYANLTEFDILTAPLYSSGERIETDHTDGQVVNTYAYAPPPGGIYPCDTSGTWTGTVASVTGTYLGSPFDLRAGNSVISFTINDGAVQIDLNEGPLAAAQVVDDIIALTGGSQDIYNGGVVASQSIGEDDLVAVRAVGNSGYELFDLFRNTAAGDLKISEGGDVLTVSEYTYGANGAADQLAGQYIVDVLSQ